MITKEQILEAGYKFWQGYQESCRAGNYQKRVYTLGGKTAYFIDVEVWDFSAYEMPQTALDKNRFVIGSHLYLQNGTTIEVKIHNDEAVTIQSAEEIIDKAYRELGCVPDLHNND